MLRIGVTGVAGRMGRSLIKAISESANSGVLLSAAIHHSHSDYLGMDAGEMIGAQNLGVPVVGSINESDFDLLIDFTLPNPCLDNIDYCVINQKPVVVGTTGFTANQIDKIHTASNKIPVVLAPNMSVGVNLALHLLDTIGGVLDDSFDVEITTLSPTRVANVLYA